MTPIIILTNGLVISAAMNVVAIGYGVYHGARVMYALRRTRGVR